eukprot:623355_1
MNVGRKITLFSVGAIGSVLLLSKFLNQKPKRKKTLKRAQIHIVTNNILLALNGDTQNILYSDEYMSCVLPYLTTLDYLNTMCRLSKYHYLYLHHRHMHCSANKRTLFDMLLNESNQSWNVREIQRIFSGETNSYLDIYDVMHSVCNDWKFAHDSLIDRMICIPFAIPNITMVKYWFRYISNKTAIPIRHLSFAEDTNYFISALEHPYECNLFLWIITYNLYQLNIELNRAENKNKNIIHSNFFGFEHKLQEWLVSTHLYTFLNSEISALLKLYELIMNTKNNSHYDQCFVNNLVYVLCIMFKVIFHNAELHIVRVNGGNAKMEWKNLEKLFLNNLYNVTVFIQYVVQINNNNAELFKTFKSLLKKSNIKMISNILTWFQKVNHHKNELFYTTNQNILSLDVSDVYWSLMGLKLEGTNKHNLAVRLLSETERSHN